MKNILLLNPPWINNRVMRDYYCGHTSKGDYLQPPIDLLVLSGILIRKYNISCIDSIAEKWDYNKTRKKIEKINPDIIISMTGAVSIEEDISFLKKVNKELGCKVILLGDIAYFEPKCVMDDHKFIDGIIFDFTSPTLIDFIEGKYEKVKDVAYRDGKKVVIAEKSVVRKFSIPIPRHEMFPLKKYSMPYNYYNPISSVITSFGCPYSCDFCAFAKLPFKERPINEVIDELKYLKNLGVKEITFRDYTFNGNKNRCKDLCRQMIRNKLDFKWSCEVAAINDDIEMLKLMEKAGCHLVLVGIESVDDNVLKGTNKPLRSNQTVKFIKKCQKIGIQTLGHFIFGLPDDTEENIIKTIEFSKMLGCDFASFNLYVPRVGSQMRQELLDKKKIKKSDLKKFDCSTEVAEVGKVSKEKLVELRNRAMKEFYFRPVQIIKQVRFMKTKTRVFNLMKNGFQVVLNMSKKK